MAELQRDVMVRAGPGTWQISDCIINLLITVQNELISTANSLSKTWVKYFYVFALAQGSYPTAQWTKSLSDTNKPPTLSSAASLGRCQVHWVYVCWGDPSSMWLACWLDTEYRSLWSPLLTMTPLTMSQVTHSEVIGLTRTGPKKSTITTRSVRTWCLDVEWIFLLKVQLFSQIYFCFCLSDWIHVPCVRGCVKWA